MKFAKPSKIWTKHFAWFPVRMNLGQNDAMRVVWLGTYYVRLQNVMGRDELYIISATDLSLRHEEKERHLRELEEEDRI